MWRPVPAWPCQVSEAVPGRCASLAGASGHGARGASGHGVRGASGHRARGEADTEPQMWRQLCQPGLRQRRSWTTWHRLARAESPLLLCLVPGPEFSICGTSLIPALPPAQLQPSSSPLRPAARLSRTAPDPGVFLRLCRHRSIRAGSRALVSPVTGERGSSGEASSSASPPPVNTAPEQGR